MLPSAAPSDHEFENLHKLYTKLSETRLKERQQLFLVAVQRVGYWGYCIGANQRLELTDMMAASKDYSVYWGLMLPAVRLLLGACLHMDRPEHQREQEPFLIRLNNELWLDLGLPVFTRSDEDQLIKELYHYGRNNPQTLIAALALFDAHLARFVGQRAPFVRRKRPLELLDNVFRTIVEGRNIWALRRLWLDIRSRYLYHERLDAFQREYDAQHLERERATAMLIAGLQEQAWRDKVQVDQYARSITSLSNSTIPREELLHALFLKVTSADEQICYLVEGWLESLGTVDLRLVRKSLFVPEENGARRLQVGIRLTNGKRLIVARIGTAKTLLNNEWGMLFDIASGATPVSTWQTEPNRGEIIVYNKAGMPVKVSKGSTVADYLIKQYSLEDARYVLKAYINATEVALTDELEDGCLVWVEIDRRRQKMRPLEDWRGPHRSKATHEAISTFTTKFNSDATIGLNRLIMLLQKHLERWQFDIDQDVLVTLLSAAGYNINRSSRDRIFAELAHDTTHDTNLCKLALQYYLHDALQLLNGRRPYFDWREVHLAKCCEEVAWGEMIIGTAEEGPRDPTHRRYGVKRKLTIHRLDCEKGPKRNRLELRWREREAKPDQTFALRLNLMLHNDYDGSLTQLLDLIQNELRLRVRYVNADAIHFGTEAANITAYATARSEREREMGIMRLQDTYGNSEIKITPLSPRDSRELLGFASCPYKINTDPEMFKGKPLLVVGREKQLAKLNSMVSDPETHQIMIVGYYRMGKTWLLKQFISTFAIPDKVPLYISFDAPPDGFAPNALIHQIYRDTLEQLTKLMPHAVSNPQQRPKDWQALAEWFKRVHERIGGHKFVLLLDEFSAIAAWMKNNLIPGNTMEQFTQFMARSAGFIDFVLVFQAAHVHELEIESRDFETFFRSRATHPIDVEPFERENTADLLTAPVREHYGLTPEAIDLAQRVTGGVPYLASMLGIELWRAAKRDEYSEVDGNAMIQLLREDVIDDLDWESALHRLSVEKLKGHEALYTLQLLARLQTDCGRLMPWEENATVLEQTILDQATLPDKVNRLPFLLNKLSQSGLVMRSTLNGQHAYLLCSSLLAYYLARQPLM